MYDVSTVSQYAALGSLFASGPSRPVATPTMSSGLEGLARRTSMLAVQDPQPVARQVEAPVVRTAEARELCYE